MTRERHRQVPRRLAIGLVGAAAQAIALTGRDPVVDAVVVGGLTVVAPLAFHGWGRWAVAALAASIGMRLDPGGLAALAAMPAVGASAWTIGCRVFGLGGRDRRSAAREVRSLPALAHLLAPVWAGVAALSLLSSLAGIELVGIGEPIVRLTAVHYLYAGVGALTIARRVGEQRDGEGRLSDVAIVATAMAPPIVAAGFVLGHPVPQIGGAVLMTVGVWSTAILLLADASRSLGPANQALRVVAGLTPWVPMVLAVAWATAQHVAGTPALSIPDMARIHGLANGVGFVIVGLLATQHLDTSLSIRETAGVTA